MYLYSAFGLILQSDLELPQLRRQETSHSEPDVRIRLGAVPDRLEHAQARGLLYEISAEEFRLGLDGIGSFWVRKGHEIIVRRHPDSDDDSVRVFLLGSAFGALLHQRGLLPLHASAIGVDGGCVAFVGPSGSGKSTLAAAFSRNGYPLLADDLLAVAPGPDGWAKAWPSWPQLKLWGDSMRRAGHSTRQHRRFRGLKGRYVVPVSGPVSHTVHPLTRIYVIGRGDDETLTKERMTGSDGLAALIAHTYRAQFLDGMGRRPDHFRLCTELGRVTEIYRIRRPGRRFELKQLQKLIEEDWSD